MRWISLPDELALSHLLDLRDVAQPLRDALAELPRQLGEGSPDRALAAAGRAFGLAKGERHRYGQALALLYQAEAYRCLERWEDGLDAIRTALHLRAEENGTESSITQPLGAGRASPRA